MDAIQQQMFREISYSNDELIDDTLACLRVLDDDTAQAIDAHEKRDEILIAFVLNYHMLSVRLTHRARGDLGATALRMVCAVYSLLIEE